MGPPSRRAARLCESVRHPLRRSRFRPGDQSPNSYEIATTFVPGASRATMETAIPRGPDKDRGVQLKLSATAQALHSRRSPRQARRGKACRIGAHVCRLCLQNPGLRQGGRRSSCLTSHNAMLKPSIFRNKRSAVGQKRPARAAEVVRPEIGPLRQTKPIVAVGVLLSNLALLVSIP